MVLRGFVFIQNMAFQHTTLPDSISKGVEWLSFLQLLLHGMDSIRIPASPFIDDAHNRFLYTEQNEREC